MKLLSVIILSKTDSELSFNTTTNCINSLVSSENFDKDFRLEIIVVESNVDYLLNYSYPDNVKVIVPDEDFGFHKFLNIGVKESKGDFVALCNNDLLFQKNWFKEILKIHVENPTIKSFSPIDDRFEKGKINDEYQIGYKIQQQIKGWCLVCEREALINMNYLDENFKFYYSDNDYSLSLLYYNIKHALVSKSYVRHLHKVTTKESILKKDDFFTETSTQNNIPKHLNSPNNSHILKNPRVLSDYLIYYNKWGKPDSLYRTINYAIKLNSLGLNFITRILFLIKRKYKL